MGLRRLAALLAIPLALAAVITITYVNTYVVTLPDRKYAVCIRNALPYDAWTRYDLPLSGMVYICYLPPGVHTWTVNLTQADTVRIYEIHAGTFIRCFAYGDISMPLLCPATNVIIENLGGGVVRLTIRSTKWLWVENFYIARTCIDC